MELQIKKAILHVLDSSVGIPVLSQAELSVQGEVDIFLTKHFSKIFEDDRIKNARFTAEGGEFQKLCQTLAENGDLIEASTGLATAWYQLLAENPAIPPADLVCCLLDADQTPYFGVLKLNYKSNFIHYVQAEAACNNVTLIQQRTILPAVSQRLDEAFLINLSDYSIRMIEKEYEIEGVNQFYLSQRLLHCQFDLSGYEKARVINAVTRKLGEKYLADDPAPLARLRQAVTAGMDDAGTVNLQQVAQKVFKDDPAAQREYIAEMQEAGLDEPELTFSRQLTDKKFRQHKIATDTGVEIAFPAEYFNDQEKLEFINQADGTISIMIKKIGKIVNK